MWRRAEINGRDTFRALQTEVMRRCEASTLSGRARAGWSLVLGDYCCYYSEAVAVMVEQ